VPEATIGFKVANVDREDGGLGVGFGESDQRGVRRIHLRVFQKEFLRALKAGWPGGVQDESPAADEREQAVNGGRVAAEMVAHLAEYDLGGVERAAPLPETVPPSQQAAEAWGVSREHVV